MKNFSDTNKNLVAIIGAIVAAAGTFLPFVNASLLGMSQSVQLIGTGFGWIVLIGALLGFFAGMANWGWLMLLSGAVDFAVVLIGYSRVINSDYGDEFTNMFVNSVTQRGVGFYVILVGSLLLILAFFFRNKREY
ncbi:MAG: hypothetical protein II969_18080 [Anaerolineaceae bacterium]|nr:hypothetical protein [Anaerolineaceae bacterium]